jgi:NADPH-dependent ferric siderophore reductase
MGDKHKKDRSIHHGRVVSTNAVAAHTWHVKIQASDLDDLHYAPGSTVELFVSDPHKHHKAEDRKYSIWNYDPVYQILDFAICTFSHGIAARWVKTLKAGDTVHFKSPKSKLSLDGDGDHYFLIGDVTALAHLYELNRHLTDKKVFSFIYASDRNDIYADIDGSYPLDHYIIDPLSARQVAKKVAEAMPKHIEGKGIAYILGEPDACIRLHDYFKDELHWKSRRLNTKPFWKNKKHH